MNNLHHKLKSYVDCEVIKVGRLGESTLKPFTNCNHKYNFAIMNFFGNLWTSHLIIIILELLNIFD